MLRNYLLVGLRNLLRHKAYITINVVGLALGLACSILLLLFVHRELSWDRHHERLDQIHLVLHEIREADGSTMVSRGTPGPLAPALKRDFAEVQHAVRLYRMRAWVGSEDNAATRSVCLVDPEIFEVFTYPLTKGDPHSALAAPSSILMTEEMARVYFGDEDPIGRILEVENGILSDYGQVFTVTGILSDLPGTATQTFDFLLSAPPRFWSAEHWTKWRSVVHWADVQTYVLLPTGYDPINLEQRLSADFARRYAGDDATGSFRVQPLSRDYLYSMSDYGIPSQGDIRQVRLMATSAVLILLVACVNFINLSTARATRRSREVGVRKAIGGHRRQLAYQFFGESSLLVVPSFSTVLVLVGLMLPTFNALLITPLSLNAAPFLLFGIYAVGLLLVVALLAGGYPALYLSAIKPVESLKGKWRSSRSGTRLRRGLVLFQFAVSAFLLIGTAVIYSQKEYMIDHSLNAGKDHIVSMWVYNKNPELQSDPGVVKSEFLKHPGVLRATILMGGIPDEYYLKEVQAEGKSERVKMYTLSGDEDFLEVYGIELMVGRNIERAGEYLLNEAAVAQLGWTDPLGRELMWKRAGPVVGVVKDFHYESFREEIKPLFITYCPFPQVLTVRLSAERLHETMVFLKTTFEKRVGQEFSYLFLDDQIEALYRSELRINKVLTVFGLVAILVACLGLLGLIESATESRTKEVGIRKVLGASVPRIVLFMTRELFALVCVANVLIWPLAWYATGRWLEDYAYRIELGWAIFAVPSGFILILSCMTIAYKSIKTATANPVLALRYE